MGLSSKLNIFFSDLFWLVHQCMLNLCILSEITISLEANWKVLFIYEFLFVCCKFDPLVGLFFKSSFS